MSELLVVGNPRHGRKRKSNRRRRRSHARAARPRRRRRVAVLHNPRRHRRVRARRHVRRRRHSNPFKIGGSGPIGVGAVIKGITGAGLGAVGARLVSNLVKNQFLPTASPAVKIGIEAAVGVVGSIVLAKAGQRALAAGLAVGAGVVVAMDIYDQFIGPTLIKSVPLLADYQVGELNGWAPQPGMSNYEVGTLNDTDPYSGGAYD